MKPLFLIVALHVQAGDMISDYQFSKSAPKVQATVSGRAPEEIVLKAKDVKEINSAASSLLKQKSHATRFCNRRQVTVVFNSKDVRDFCLDSKTPAGNSARRLRNLLELASKLR